MASVPNQMPAPPRWIEIHPTVVRVTHWLNALAIVIMVTSGWRIYNGSPFWPFTIPAQITLGGWLAGALMWHFAAMWLLVINGVVYLAYNILSGRLASKFFPLSPSAVLHDLGSALRGHLAHDDPRRYNAVQKLAYLGVMLLIAVLILSGLAIWKPVQLQEITALFGDYEIARRVHFICMALIVVFFIVHIVMVALVPKTFIAIITGRASVPSRK